MNPRGIVFYLVLVSARLAASAEPLDRSPVDLAIAGDGRWLVTANETSDTVSLVDLTTGRVAGEFPCGKRPAAVVFSADGRKVFVTAAFSGELWIYDFKSAALHPAGWLQVGGEPRGIALAKDGKTAYVALTGEARVVVVDLVQRAVRQKIAVGRWPRYLALSPDESRLAVGTSGDQSVSVVDPRSGELLYQEVVGGLNLGHMQTSADGQYVYFPWMVYRHNPITAANIRKGWVLGSRVARVRLDGPARREAITLDPPGMAVADPYGLALSGDERRLVVTASGTHELLVYGLPKLNFVAFGGPGDHIEPGLLADRKNFFRVPLGGRPMGVRLSADGRRAYVANWLSNALQVVDLEARQIEQTIDLGGARQPSLARCAAVFYDGRRSLDQWYSCHSCHYDGGPNSEPMDTKNDGSTRTFKTVPSLVGVAHTGPWTWHGWQKNLGDAARVSITETMLGPTPSADDIRAVVAMLNTLDAAPNPNRGPQGSLTPAAARGKALFASQRAGCATCHSGNFFTDGQIHDVGLGADGDVYHGFNTPSLLGVFRRVRYLHDGRAKSLEAVLAGDHNPQRVVGGGPLSDEERHDLIEYLKTL